MEKRDPLSIKFWEAAIAFKEEMKMNEIVNITKKSLQKAYDKGCEDVQDVLKDLFPDDIEEEEEEFCCSNFRMYYSGDGSHKKFILDSKLGDYYVFPDIDGWEVKYCLTCGAHYDGKKWTSKV